MERESYRETGLLGDLGLIIFWWYYKNSFLYKYIIWFAEYILLAKILPKLNGLWHRNIKIVLDNRLGL